MAKKEEKEIEKEIKEPEIEKNENKIEKAVEKAETKVEKARGERVNVIGDITPPDTSDKEDTKRFLKDLSDKVDELLGYHRPKEPKKEDSLEPVKKTHWLDREII